MSHEKKESTSKDVLKSKPEDIKKWVKRDIESASALLNMIRQDPDIMAMVAERITERTLALQEQNKSDGNQPMS